MSRLKKNKVITAREARAKLREEEELDEIWKNTAEYFLEELSSELLWRWLTNRRATRHSRKQKAENKLTRADRRLEDIIKILKPYKHLQDIPVEVLYGLLYGGYLDARKKKRTTYNEHDFEVNEMQNIMCLTNDILLKKYKPSRSEAFVIKDPVIREVFAAPFRDRIVHHLAVSVVYPYWEKKFVNCSFSCRYGKGTYYAVNKLRHHMGKITKNGKEDAYIITMDIKGFFMSMRRKDLLRLVMGGLKDQFPHKGAIYELSTYLWEEIIMDDPVQGMRVRGDINDWNLVPRDKCLVYQPEGQGIVIGNLSSQLLSNIVLNQLDHFVVDELGYDVYGRYVDDFYIGVRMGDVEKAKKDIKLISKFLLDIGFRIHPKKIKWHRVKDGLTFTGRRVFINHTEMKKRYKNEYRKVLCRLLDGEAKLKDLDRLKSFMGGNVEFMSIREQQKLWEYCDAEFAKEFLNDDDE